MTAAIPQLLAPLSPDVFFRDYWEQRYCLVARSDAAHYETLLRRRDLDALLYHYRQPDAAAQGARVTLVKSAEHNAMRQPTPTTEAGTLDIPALYEAYGRGYTLIIDSVQTRWPAIAELCQSLEARLHFGVQANVYVTPRGAQGFAAHFDKHDVFVLQVSGSKTWRVYEGGYALPMADTMGHPDPATLGTPAMECLLRQGDLLYLPRGVVHEASTTDDSSIHITIGLHVWRWADLLRESIASLADSDVRLRTAIPVGLLGDGRDADLDELQLRLRELLRSCAESAEVRGALRRMGGRLVARREPVPDGHFESLDRLDEISADTWMRRRAGMLCGVSQQGEKATIVFPGGSMTGPATLERALRYVAAAETFQVRDLPGPAWGPLSEKAQIVLAKRLVRSGLLAIAERSQ